jgi:hypothetical protein
VRPAFGDIDLIGTLRLCADTVVDGVTFGERGKRQRHILAHVHRFSSAPPLFAEATMNIAECIANECVRVFLAQFRLKTLTRGTKT